jgi:hypothetical protein
VRPSLEAESTAEGCPWQSPVPIGFHPVPQIDADLHLAVVEENQLAGSNRPREAKGQSAGDEDSEAETHASKIGNHSCVA